jgi:23S rRNA (cytidine1920-2'-O)/16S rRNA (cytidine1409-2'-O)-methyltransferase
MAKVRVDVLLQERGLAESRSRAQRLIMAGQVRVAGQVVQKPSTRVAEDAELTVDHGPAYVSRGGDKLAAALASFSVPVDGRVCADVGASTGGFTDCLLQHGAMRVYAIDVGQGILHWKMRKDPRVTVMEKTNARYIKALPETVTLVTIDASFISLALLLPVVQFWFGEAGGEVIALIKPQFEAGKSEVSRGKGVIRDPSVHRKVIYDVLHAAQEAGYRVEGVMRSPLRGPKGNVEFMAWLGYPARAAPDFKDLVENLFTPEELERLNR